MMRATPTAQDSTVRATPFPTFRDTPARPSFLASLALLLLAVAVCVAGGMAAGYQGGALPRPGEVSWAMIQAGMPYSACGLLVLFTWQHVRGGIFKAFVGERVLGPLANGLLRLALTLGIGYAVMRDQGMAPEPYLAHLFDGLAPGQVQRLMLQLVLFTAISEELLLRHYVMGVLGWQDGGWWKWAAIGASAAVYMSLPLPYESAGALVLLMVIGVIIGIARVNSRGMLVPILLHGAAMGGVLAVGHWQVAI